MLFNKSLQDTNLADLQDLINNQVAENRELDYKESLNISTDDEKKEFLYDVTSFANCIGGYLIYGISEKRGDDGKCTGLPEQIVGIKDFNPDVDTRKLLSIVRDGTDPKLSAIEIHAINLDEGGVVLVIRISKRLDYIHQVVFKKSSKFYSRTSKSKYQMDVREIRSAFLDSDGISGRIRAFQRDRLAQVLSNDTPATVEHGPIVIYHAIPISAFDGRETLELSMLHTRNSELKPWATNSWSGRYNLDGYLIFPGANSAGKHTSYHQVFRNGCIESAVSFTFTSSNLPRHIPSTGFEKITVDEVTSALSFLRNSHISAPVVVFISLINIKDCTFQAHDDWNDSAVPLNRNCIQLPEVTFEDYGCDVGLTLKPAFDILWQAGGYSASRNFSNGKWTPPPR